MNQVTSNDTNSQQVCAEDVAPWVKAALFPKTVAIIGASDNPEKIGGRPIKYMRQYGFSGRIFPVNPSRSHIQGIPAWTSVEAIPEPIEMALICVAGDKAVAAVEACANLGVVTCVVISSGFGETDEIGRQAQERMKAAAQASGMRLIGPNTQGLANFQNGTLATFATLIGEVRPDDGPVAIISQSGAMSMVPYAHLRSEGIGVRYSLATGNECDLTVADFTWAVAQDPGVRLILIYLEALPNPDVLARAATLAARRGIPILALKSGVSARGASAALSHTGAVATEDRVLDAWFRQHGILRVTDMRSLVKSARLLLQSRRMAGPRLTILSNSGAACVTGADAAERHGLELSCLAEKTRQAIDTVLPSFASSLNPIDLTAALLSNNHLFGDVLPALASDDAIDALFISLPMSGKGYDAQQFASDAARFQLSTGKPTVMSCPLADTRETFEQAGVVAFEHDEDALGALGQLAKISLLQGQALRLHSLHQSDAPTPAPAVSERHEGLLSEADSLEYIEAIGIRTVPWRLCRDLEAMSAALRTLKGPWVIKACSAEIPHKSDYGLVKVGIGDMPTALNFFSDMQQRCHQLGKSFDGIIVATMVAPQRELMIGARWDEQFGCVVIVGDGGKYIEAMPDVATLVYPFDAAYAQTQLRQLRISALYDGIRGEPAFPLEKISKAVVAVGSWLQAQRGTIASIDINPLMVGVDGTLLAADALVEVATRGSLNRGNTWIAPNKQTISSTGFLRGSPSSRPSITKRAP